MSFVQKTYVMPGLAAAPLVALAVAWTSPGRAAELGAPPSLQAWRCPSCEVRVDAVFDEPVWSRAERSDHFVQLEPTELAPATEQTWIQVAFDDEDVYVAVYARDSQPPMAPLGRRDTEPVSDWIRVAFDSYADRRTAFEFGVNPAGVKVDDIISGDRGRDLTWDAVWDAATRRVDDGWVAELRIPLSELRFNGSGAEWGFQVTRVIQRTKETDVWAPTLKSDIRPVPRYGALLGMRGLESSRSVQLVPYLRADGSRPAQQDALWTDRAGGLGLRVGGDVKARVTSNLTLDATVLPDFGQVEADPSVVNLTAFESYFTERRPFFIEGSDILRFGIGIGDGDLGRDTLYYSRRVGGLPYNASLDYGSDDTVAHEPTSTEIYGAAKLSGKTAGGTSLAFLEAVTGEARAKVDWAPRTDGDTGLSTPARSTDELVAPRTNYFVARAQQDLRDGHTTLGVIGTSVARASGWGSSVVPAPTYATTGGLDLNHRSMNDEWGLSLSLAGSQVSGSAEAITNVQEAPARYYQRPDQTYLKVDPSLTSLSGYAATLTGGKFGGEPWRFGLFGMLRSPGFESNDLGFLARADWAVAVFWGNYTDRKPGKVFRQVSLNTNWAYGTNYGGDTTNLMANFEVDLELLNYWGVYSGLEVDPSWLDTSMLRGGPAVRLPTHASGWTGIYSDERRPVRARLQTVYGLDVTDRGLDVVPSITIQPTPRLNLQLELTYSYRERDRQYVDTVTDAAATHWIVGHMTQDTYVLLVRADLAITPDLTLQLYAQPFVSGGAYSDYREVVDGRAARLDDRFAPYSYDGSADFNFKQFRSTAVLRWEYRPGSALFVVWSQDRTNEDGPGAVALGRDTRALFDTAGENVLLVKFSYWMGI